MNIIEFEAICKKRLEKKLSPNYGHSREDDGRKIDNMPRTGHLKSP